MKHFNLTMAEGSLVYEAFSYPGGEQQVRLRHEALAMAQNATAIRVTAHLKTGEDFMRLALLKSALDGVNAVHKTLVLPYLPYARADRRFMTGDCFGLEAFATIINALAFECVVTLDAHSGVAGGLIRNLTDASPLPLIERAIHKFAAGSDGITVLFPDEGAATRYVLPDRIGSNTDGIAIQKLLCTKRRDAATGKLLGFNVPKLGEFAYQRALVVDDICDGGGTFMGIAGELDGAVELGLYVTHGIFSRGFELLRGCFSRIYCTDSTGKAWPFEDVHVFPSALALR